VQTTSECECECKVEATSGGGLLMEVKGNEENAVIWGRELVMKNLCEWSENRIDTLTGYFWDGFGVFL
jgi:hypothetical protein